MFEQYFSTKQAGCHSVPIVEKRIVGEQGRSLFSEQDIITYIYMPLFSMPTHKRLHRITTSAFQGRFVTSQKATWEVLS